MQKFSDEELVLNYCISCMGFNSDDEDEVKRNMLLQTELLSRLNRGRKAIEFVEALIMHRDNGVDLEAEGRIYNWIDEYQQLCKEAADGN